MSAKVTALLVFHQTRPFNEIKAALGMIAVPTERAHTLAEAKLALSDANPPLLAFTESELPDGKWWEIVVLLREDIFAVQCHCRRTNH